MQRLVLEIGHIAGLPAHPLLVLSRATRPSSSFTAMAVFAVWVLHRFGERIGEELNLRELPKLPVSYSTLLYAAAVPFTLLAIVTMIVAGHSGAELVWKTNAG